MKSKVLLLTLLFALLACNKNTHKVDVEITNANGKTAYLQKIINNETVNVDSCLIENNKAVFNINNGDDNDAYHIFIKGWRRALPFFTDNNNVTIKGDFNAYHKIVINASKTQSTLDELNKEMNDMDDRSIKSTLNNYVKNNSESALSPYLIYRYKWAFNLSELKKLSSLFPETLNSGYKGKLTEYIELLERTDVGKDYIDFTLNNTEGQAITISDIVNDNNLVMIDFWASWCPDCRVENPNVVAVYNDFKDKGLEIISVSLDTDKDAWLKGIKEDNLYWENHLSDLKGWNCVPATEYGVAFIPQNVLINNNGKIVAKNLNGEELKTFVSRYLR